MFICVLFAFALYDLVGCLGLLLCFVLLIGLFVLFGGFQGCLCFGILLLVSLFGGYVWFCFRLSKINSWGLCFVVFGGFV